MKPFDASSRVPAHACAANFRGYRRAFRNNIQLTEIRYRVTISLPFHLRYRAARKESKWILLLLPPAPLVSPSFFVETRIRSFVRSFVSTQDGRDHHLYLFSVSPSFGKKKNSFFETVDRIARNYTSNRRRFIRMGRRGGGGGGGRERALCGYTQREIIN